MDQESNSGVDLQQIRLRIREKQRSYASYDLSPAQNDLLRAFFDLAQEFDSNEDFYRVCVVALSEFLGLHSRLYFFDKEQEKLILVCESRRGLLTPPVVAPDHVRLAFKSYESEHSLLVPIHCKPSSDRHDEETQPVKLQVMGVIEVYPLEKISRADRFFLRKYTNRIGYNLHNRLIAHENVRHLHFINNLVMDIEHNVITPNMYFKHLFNQLKASIEDVDGLERLVLGCNTVQGVPSVNCDLVLSKVSALHRSLLGNHRELLEHHANYSLFLESLLRRDHFAQGRFVLHPRKCSIDREIVSPQLEHYLSRFAARGIVVEKPEDMQEEELFLRVDVGLLSQVYANLFSNAVKYTGKITNRNGEPRKAMTYGRELLADYFGPGKAAVKFNVFTTGEHLSEVEAKTVFVDGVRGERGKSRPGKGHGLAFIKQVVEIHGGVAGYEATEEGNNFYFILPLSDPSLLLS
ncbi:MAG TPA: ATP-binding protein [Desulfobulbaceae bacterium]|nr:MAG: ATP-binding protein [Deltaproteobacteria bacterium RIFOXYD12_FULL_53_23]HCC54334.1 ATP-binding protein [Desulfobulbaceae bacterium]